MPSKVYSAVTIGLDAEKIEVECDAGTGQFHFIIVGLPDTAVQEARERVRSAIKNSGCSFPRGRVTVNLAPADMKKQGSLYDLPIAISILLADKDTSRVFPESAHQEVQKSLCVGELSLDGEVRPVSGVIAIAYYARHAGFDSVFVPEKNAREAALIEGLTVYPVRTFSQCVDHLMGTTRIIPLQSESDTVQKIQEETIQSYPDLSHIRGQERAKRALEIAAAGGHNILLSGQPGAGKTMLARTLPGLLPLLTLDEALEVTRIYSVSGALATATPLAIERPFRSPHHTASVASLIGGGSTPAPGEVSLAHRGVLFLDEFPEFPRSAIEALRQPLEDGWVTVSRAAGTVRYPARCMLVAAQNPCPCGNRESKIHECTCSSGAIHSYQKKISGPILDRIDLFVDVPPVEYDELLGGAHSESSATVRDRIARARNVQRERLLGENLFMNSEMQQRHLETICPLDSGPASLLRSAAEKFGLSARSYSRIIKIARTIADLSESENITEAHIAESLQYRPFFSQIT